MVELISILKEWSEKSSDTNFNCFSKYFSTELLDLPLEDLPELHDSNSTND